jgi:hypothetical protein
MKEILSSFGIISFKIVVSIMLIFSIIREHDD